MPVKTTVNERIAMALKRSDKSQRDLAKFMGFASASVNAMLSKPDLDSIKYLQAVENLTGFSFEWLRTGNGPEMKSELGGELDEETRKLMKETLRAKEDLIDELRGRIGDMTKYQMLLEENLEAKKKEALELALKIKAKTKEKPKKKN